MLSFDITDRHIRIIRGTENGGRIRVSSASTIDLEEGLVVNGHIKDIPKMATIISEDLKAKKMADKEAVVSMCSNLVIFREIHIPKVKGTQLLTMVTNQMQHQMGIAEDYSISYSIAGEVEEDGVQALKILATACPFEVVDCFRKVFQMLSISLKSVMVSCNAISRVILGDKKITAGKMPMLAVQIDPTFISLNLYENNQLAFSRFASIDAADYEDSADYIYEAVNENIYRMLQFQKSRNANAPIQNVVFYGDTTNEYIRLTNSLESMDISTSLLGTPGNIGGYENFEFQSYANAIGAMYKSNKESERVNLLETDATSGKTEAGASFAIAVLASAGVAAAVVAIICLAINIGISNTQKKIDAINNEINSEETQAKLAEVDRTQEKIDKVGIFKSTVKQAADNYKSLPMFRSDIYYAAEDCFAEAGCNALKFSYTEGNMDFDVFCDEPDIPSKAVELLTAAVPYDTKLYNGDTMFDNVVYTGYKGDLTKYLSLGAPVESTDVNEAYTSIFDNSPYEFEVTMKISSNIVNVPEGEETPADEETEETTEGGEG